MIFSLKFLISFFAFYSLIFSGDLDGDSSRQKPVVPAVVDAADSRDLSPLLIAFSLALPDDNQSIVLGAAITTGEDAKKAAIRIFHFCNTVKAQKIELDAKIKTGAHNINLACLSFLSKKGFIWGSLTPSQALDQLKQHGEKPSQILTYDEKSGVYRCKKEFEGADYLQIVFALQSRAINGQSIDGLFGNKENLISELDAAVKECDTSFSQIAKLISERDGGVYSCVPPSPIHLVRADTTCPF